MLRLLITPFYLLLPPLLLLLSLPLAIFAAFTTTLAVTTLLFRVSLVYMNIGLALLQHYLFSQPASHQKQRIHDNKSPKLPSPTTPTATPANGTTTPLTARRSTAKSSPSSIKSFRFEAETAHAAATLGPSRSSDSYTSLIGSCPPDRDYEGVGGWREASSAANDDEEEARWTRMNARLELPAPAGLRVAAAEAPVKPRRHRRSLTGSSQWLRMSPVQSRARSPSAREEEGYFGMVLGMGKQKATSVVSLDTDYQRR